MKAEDTRNVLGQRGADADLYICKCPEPMRKFCDPDTKMSTLFASVMPMKRKISKKGGEAPMQISPSQAHLSSSDEEQVNLRNFRSQKAKNKVVETVPKATRKK